MIIIFGRYSRQKRHYFLIISTLDNFFFFTCNTPSLIVKLFECRKIFRIQSYGNRKNGTSNSSYKRMNKSFWLIHKMILGSFQNSLTENSRSGRWLVCGMIIHPPSYCLCQSTG